MVLECLTMGNISKLFQSLEKEQRKKIAIHFGFDERLLMSWFHILTYVRNLCAHHSRLWDKKLIIKPKIAKKFQREMSDNNGIYVVAFIIDILLKEIGINLEWRNNLSSLLKRYGEIVNLEKMYFPKDWKEF
jgi:abortive infection bacteriophage resistance protein